MKKNISLLILSIVFTSFSLAQSQEIELWPSGVPNALENTNYNEITDTKLDRVSHVKNPTLTVFIPEKPNGTSMVICPGGGYAYLAINKEGYKVAEWLNTLGITAFVLKYRLPNDSIMQDKSIGPLQDAQESIRYIRRQAEKWHLNTNKIGVIGFSAGGHLASTSSTHYDDLVYRPIDSTSAKPNFSILVYPVISMDEKIAHKGSRNRLLGINPSSELVDKFSNEKQVDSLTPCAFLVHATNDNGVPVENTLAYYLALKNSKISAELHIYQDGKHGFGLGNTGTSQNWTKHCEAWLRVNNYIN